MREFVEECRREWKRLRVPDPVANEMAADLEADLAEAEADGASAEEVLGSGAFDPRGFAAAWAAERGVVQPPQPPSGGRRPRRSRMAAATAAFGLVAIIGVVLAIAGSPSRSDRMAVAWVASPRPGVVVPPVMPAAPLPRAGVPRPRVVPPPFPGAGGSSSSFDVRPLGLLLMVVGIAGLLLSMLYWAPWAGFGRRSRPHTS